MHNANNLSAASAPLMIYCALAGVAVFGMLAVSSVFNAEEPHDFDLMIGFLVPSLLSLILGMLAWGVRHERKWAWVPATGFAAVFAMAFPIGTIISYHDSDKYDRRPLTSK